jgi:cyclic pyranopterin phosphate synthase
MTAERVAYRYAEIERKHRFRFLFDPLRLLTQSGFVRRYLAGENPFPLSVEIDPSNACNHDCGFCIYHALHQPGRNERLPRDLLLSLVDQVGELGSTSVLFVGGGEPMTNPNTVEALERASAVGLSCGLVTNGSLVDPEKGERLKRAATYVRFSLDAASPETHLKLHRRGDFPSIVRNFTHLARAAGPATVGTGYFICQENVQEIVSAARLVKEAGGDYIQFKTSSGTAFPAELHERVLLEIEQALPLADARFDIHVAERIFENQTFQVRGYTRCHFQAMKTVINADGLVYLCAQKRTSPDGAIGSVYESSLAEIWCGERRRRVVESLQLADCPYCVHDRQNRILEFLAHFRAPHRGFY